MKSITRFLLIAVLCAGTAQAQQKLSASWTAKFDASINWQRVHSLGYIVVSTNRALYAVNPDDGKILWENKSFPALDAANYEEVDGTQFLAITYKQEENATFPLQAIIDVESGRVMFDSQKEGIAVISRHVLPSSGKLLIVGVRPKTFSASLFMYEIASGQQLWANDDLFKAESTGKGFFGKLQSFGEQLSNIQSLTSDPIELDATSVLITHRNYVMRINSETGDVVWKNKIDASTGAQVIFSPFQEGIVYVGVNVESDSGSGFTTTSSASSGEPQKFYYNEYYAFNLESGNPVWKQPAKEEDMLNIVIPHKEGLIICPRSSQKPTINLVDYNSGETVWGKKGKGIKAQGSVVSYIDTPQGILITTAFDNAWNNKAEEYYLNVLDPATGALKYDKSVKLKGDIVSSELTPKGLLFITTKEVNILDTNTGDTVWPSSIEAGNPNSSKIKPFPTADDGHGKLFVYSPSDHAVYQVDKEAGTSKQLTQEKIDFEGKELPNMIEAMPDGLILGSEQNLMKIGFDGSVKYQSYYPAPREPALMRALLAAEAIRAAYIGAAASMYSAAFEQGSQQATDVATKETAHALSQGFGELGNVAFAYSGAAMKLFSARFKASLTAPGFVMMMTKQEKRGNQLVQVSKTDGSIMNAIDIKNDKEPEYELDQIYNYVYYRATDQSIVCYKL